MTRAYYNEINPFNVAWLENLISAGLIAPGDVDNRSIEDVTPGDLTGYTQCHFFAGIGIWSHALRSAGWSDSRPVWTMSCPCQPFSEAGEGGGFADERHLWPAAEWLIRQCQPDVVFGEQVEAAIKHGWLDLVSTDLENLGYSVGSTVLSAAGFGGPHIRHRVFWVGDSNYKGLEGHAWDGDQSRIESPTGPAPEAGGPVGGFWNHAEWLDFRDGVKRPVQPGLRPMAPRHPKHMDLCSSYGNAIVAPVAEAFIRAHMSCTARQIGL